MRTPSIDAQPCFDVQANPDATLWDAFVASQPNGHLLQCTGWEVLKTRFGWQSARLGLVRRGESNGPSLAAGALLLVQQRWGVRLGYVPRGPVVDWDESGAAPAVVDALRAECARRGASVLKVEPELPDTPENRNRLLALGFVPSPQTVQPRSTIRVDLGSGEDARLARMKSKWRYNIRLAERKGVTVRECQAADLGVFQALMAETAARDRFDVHAPAYYAEAFRLLAPKHAVFLLAEFEGKPLAAIVVATVGPMAWYLWGASGDRERNRMPNHALQWHGMRWAAQRGARVYDLWGIPDEVGAVAQGLRAGDGSGTPVDEVPIDVENLPTYGLWGVYRFKQGFGGEIVRAVGAWDMPIQRAGYELYRMGLQAHAAQRTARTWTASRTWAASRTAAEGVPVGSTEASPGARVVSGEQEWQSALSALPDAHVLQSWAWGEVKAQTGWKAERVLLANGGGAFQFLTRQPVPALPVRIGYVPKGPIVDWGEAAAVRRVLDALQQHARARRCLVVKIDPDVDEGSETGIALVAALRKRGWRYSGEQVQFKNTAVTDLRAGEEAVLAAMKSKWRYNVRLAEKRGVGVRVGGEDDLPAFYALYAETGRRDGFLVRPWEYYRLLWRRFLEAQRKPSGAVGGAVLLAEHADENEPVAGLFLLRSGRTAWYFHGASSERRRRDMPNHLLQWQAMRWAMAQGCERYDWWGAPTDPEDPADAMQGVWAFKEGFGAELVRHIGAWDYPVYPRLYRAYERLLAATIALLHRRHDRNVTPLITT